MHIGKGEQFAENFLRVSPNNKIPAIEYSIADMATYPWLRSHTFQGQNLDDYPSIRRWYSTVRERHAVQRGLAVLKERFEKNRKPPTGAALDNLFGSKQFGRPSDGSSPQ